MAEKANGVNDMNGPDEMMAHKKRFYAWYESHPMVSDHGLPIPANTVLRWLRENVAHRGVILHLLTTGGDAIKVSSSGSDVPVVPEFTALCNRCGSSDVLIDNSIQFGGTWTGQYGSIDIRCNKCNNSYTAYS